MKMFKTFDKETNMLQCRKRPIIVHCKQINEQFQVETLEGNYKTGKPGDYLMQGVKDELYICDREIFEATYDILKPQSDDWIDREQRILDNETPEERTARTRDRV